MGGRPVWLTSDFERLNIELLETIFEFPTNIFGYGILTSDATTIV
jgi:hypothetical protein